VSDANAELEREMAAEAEGLPAVKHYMRECEGMFEYQVEDEQLLVKNLITGMLNVHHHHHHHNYQLFV